MFDCMKRQKPPRIDTEGYVPMHAEFQQFVPAQMPPWYDVFSEEQFQRTLRRLRRRQERQENERLIQQREPLLRFIQQQQRNRDEFYYMPEMERLALRPIEEEPQGLAIATTLGRRRNRVRREGPVQMIEQNRAAQLMRPRNRRV